MGIHAVRAALAVEPVKITNRQRLVLATMAAWCLDTSTDRNAARTYFGGWEMLARCMGMPPTTTVLRGIARDVAALVEVGVVEVVERGRTGHNARYRLRLPAVDKDGNLVENPP